MQCVTVFALVVCIGLSMALRPTHRDLEGYTFEKYVTDFNKEYSSDSEKIQRGLRFEQTLQRVKAHNAANKHMWKEGVNHLSDRFPHELKAMNGNKIMSMPRTGNAMSMPMPPAGAAELSALPPTVDYRQKVPAVLSAIKDQGNCGGCYSFSAMENIESHYALKTRQLFSLSPQEGIACVPNPKQCGGVGGCNGSTSEIVFDYIVSHGVSQEFQFPYVSYSGKTNGTCTQHRPVVFLSGYTSIPDNNQKMMMYALAYHGPLAINVDASKWSGYETGIYHGCGNFQTHPIAIDHAVQLVGYGTDSLAQQDYWVVRNSWNPTWGENGFIRLLRTPTPFCGWNVNATTYGGACKGQNPNQWVCGECGLLFGAAFPNVAV